MLLPGDADGDGLCESGFEAGHCLDQRSPQMTITAFAFWQQLFLHRTNRSSPPQWDELLAQ